MDRYVQANFEIESNKKELVRAIANRKGMTFKEFVNYAIDIAIKGETKEKAYLLQDKQLLENELRELEDKYDNDKATIENKIKEIDITLENMTVEYEEKSEQDDYNKIFNIVYRGTKIDDVEDLIKDHASKYNYDVDDLRRKIEKEVAYKKFM